MQIINLSTSPNVFISMPVEALIDAGIEPGDAFEIGVEDKEPGLIVSKDTRDFLVSNKDGIEPFDGGFRIRGRYHDEDTDVQRVMILDEETVLVNAITERSLTDFRTTKKPAVKSPRFPERNYTPEELDDIERKLLRASGYDNDIM